MNQSDLTKDNKVVGKNEMEEWLMDRSGQVLAVVLEKNWEIDRLGRQGWIGGAIEWKKNQMVGEIIHQIIDQINGIVVLYFPIVGEKVILVKKGMKEQLLLKGQLELVGILEMELIYLEHVDRGK